MSNELQSMRENIEALMKTDYRLFMKALISIEKEINTENVLDDIYDKWMEIDSYGVLDEGFNQIIEEIGIREKRFER